MVELAYPLLLAHLVGDFAVQTDWMIRAKARYGPAGAIPHVATVALLTLLVVTPALASWWPYVLLIGITHLILDVGKVGIDRRINNRALSITLFWLDQLFHVAIIALTATLADRAGLGAIWRISDPRWQWLLLFVIATFVVGILFRALAPFFGWPNRWPAAAGRAGLFVLVAFGLWWLAWLPPLAALFYLREPGQPLSRPVLIEAALGYAAALGLALLALPLPI